MDKLEKTLNDLPFCIRCAEREGYSTFASVMRDALELLKAQEPHVMTEADFDHNPMVDPNGNLPAWCEHKELNGMIHSEDGWITINRRRACGQTLERYWTSRPTEEQREATPWQ